MLYEQLKMHNVVRVTLALTVAALLTTANVSAALAGDDDDDSFATKFMSVLGFKKPAESSAISYGERSPLVVPPSRDLPPPVAAGAPTTPAWPKDPDLKRNKEAKAQKKKGSNSTYDFLEDSRPLRPDEQEKGRIRGRDEGKPAIDAEAGMNPSSQAQLGNKKGFFSGNWFKKEEYATFTGEPVRGELTDPPAGYRTPSTDQPYGIGPDRTPAKATTLYERTEAQSGR